MVRAGRGDSQWHGIATPLHNIRDQHRSGWAGDLGHPEPGFGDEQRSNPRVWEWVYRASDGIRPGSQWNNTAGVYVGGNGQAILTIQNGGAVSDAVRIVGSSNGATGTVAVNGSGSAWHNTNYLDVGVQGTGTLTIANGGLVAAGTLRIRELSRSARTAQLTPRAVPSLGTCITTAFSNQFLSDTSDGNVLVASNGTMSFEVAGKGSGQYGQFDITGSGLSPACS